MTCTTCNNTLHPFGKKFACISCMTLSIPPSNKKFLSKDFSCTCCKNQNFEKLEPMDIFEQYNVFVDDTYYVCSSCGTDSTHLFEIHNYLNSFIKENNQLKFSNKFLDPQYFL